jgi:hypothetical protein
MIGRHLLLSLAFAAAAIGVSPGGAQCRLCDAPRMVREQDGDDAQVQVEIDTSLNFDRLIVDGEGEGSALIRPDGSRSAMGAVTDISPRAIVGSVTIRGEAGRTIRVELPRQVVLYSLSGGRISFDDVTSDLPANPRLDSAGRLTFRFGGRIRVSGDAEGDFRGDLPITAEYL